MLTHLDTFTQTVGLPPERALETAREHLAFHRKFTVMPPEVLAKTGLAQGDGAIRLKCPGMPVGSHVMVYFQPSGSGSSVTAEARGEDGQPLADQPPFWGHTAREVLAAVKAACDLSKSPDPAILVIAGALLALIAGLVLLLK